MAKQNGPVIWEFTIGCFSFYKRGGRGYARMKSNLTAERWRIDPAFEGSRKCAETMAQSSVIASGHYRVIPKHQRCYPFYKRLVGIAQEMGCAGFTEQHIHTVLDFAVGKYLRKLAAKAPGAKPVRSSFSVAGLRKVIPAFRPACNEEGVRRPVYAAPLGNQPVEKQHADGIPIRGRPYKISERFSIPPTPFASSHVNDRPSYALTSHFPVLMA